MLQRVLRPIVAEFQPDWPVLSAADRATVREASLSDTVRAIRGAPPHFRAAVTLLALAAAAAMAVRGTAAGLGGPFRSLERLVRSLTLLSVFEHPAVKDALGIERGPDRQARMRDLRADGAPR